MNKTYSLLTVSAEGEKLEKTFDAPSLKDACQAHVTEYKAKKGPFSLVLLLPNMQIRHSYNDSVAFINACHNAEKWA